MNSPPADDDRANQVETNDGQTKNVLLRECPIRSNTQEASYNGTGLSDPIGTNCQ